MFLFLLRFLGVALRFAPNLNGKPKVRLSVCSDVVWVVFGYHIVRGIFRLFIDVWALTNFSTSSDGSYSDLSSSHRLLGPSISRTKQKERVKMDRGISILRWF